MKIITYEYSEIKPADWSINKIKLGQINLVVGDTASGKTRFLNTIFNLGRMVTGTSPLLGSCKWDIVFEHLGVNYQWKIQTARRSDNRVVIAEENLSQSKGGSFQSLLKRTKSSFSFQSKPLKAKLPTDTLSAAILKEEPSVMPIIEAFSLILRRNFFSDALNVVMPVTITQPKFFDKAPKSPNEISNMNLFLNPKLALLHRYFPIVYKQICDNFSSIFTFVSSIGIKDIQEIRKGFNPPGPTPVLCIKERNVRQWLSIDQLSTGMQKVMLILTDVYTMPDGSIYLIDEYENSLGVSAIDFFPPFLIELERDIQFIITSHHPYLINNIPVQNWLVFHRDGSQVQIRYGTENVEAYGESKQTRFLKLINDPFYSGNID